MKKNQRPLLESIGMARCSLLHFTPFELARYGVKVLLSTRVKKIPLSNLAV